MSLPQFWSGGPLLYEDSWIERHVFWGLAPGLFLGLSPKKRHSENMWRGTDKRELGGQEQVAAAAGGADERRVELDAGKLELQRVVERGGGDGP